ncbi:phosphomannomutase [Fibrobacterales bacterium]|nr:phosphomannomutase [Fibrobacterales bacterium]
MQNTEVSSLWKKIQSPDFNSEKDGALVEQIKKIAIESGEPAKVSFGTSGWRGEIGSEFTLKNIQVVAKAILQIYKEADAATFEALGIRSFEELQTKGIVLGHDNRLLGKEFCEVVADQFLKAGVKAYYGGEMPTPEFSSAIEILGAACSVNITPSHNPSHYNGIKFNPADGGPAGPEITDKITDNSNAIMQQHKWEELGAITWEKIDPVQIYKTFSEKMGTIQYGRIQAMLSGGRVDLVCDYVHGSTRGRPAALLSNPQCLTSLRTENDPLFGGVTPEPSSKNLEGVKSVLNASKCPLRLGAIFDPDGDRIRFYDGSREVDMNSFGAIAFHYMVTWRKENGVVAKSVATSNFVNIIAGKLSVPVMETPVGFKNFRPYLKRNANPKALIAFEESDGITGLNNTLEKDAGFGLLLALEIMAVTGKNLGEYLDLLYTEYGRLYPERSGFEVDKSLVGSPMIAKLKDISKNAKVGTKIKIGDTQKVVRELLTLDGVKIIFEDESWMLIRPSGTEPKVRIYTECKSQEEKEEMFNAAKELFFK